LPRERTETDEATWKRLGAFRAKVEKRHTCVYWNSSENLKAKLIVGLTATVKRHPSVGWVRADQVPTGATLSDLLALRQRVEELERELETQRTTPPPGTEDLLQGDDTFDLSFHFLARKDLKAYPYHEDTSYEATISPTWNEIFAGVAPKMINEASDGDLRRVFRSHFESLAIAEFGSDKDLKDRELRDFSFTSKDLDTCIVQLRALGLITDSQRKRSLKDTSTYWTLTPFGDRQMVILRALRRTPTPARKSGAKSESVEAAKSGV
jgi:hypothetical protein